MPGGYAVTGRRSTRHSPRTWPPHHTRPTKCPSRRSPAPLRILSGGMSLSADDVRDAVFARSRRGPSRYTEVEVDGFLGLIEATLRGRGDLAARDVRRVSFSRPPR